VRLLQQVGLAWDVVGVKVPKHIAEGKADEGERPNEHEPSATHAP
jgi:hypothetical protein